MARNTFAANEATHGGAIASFGELTLTGNTFSGNTAYFGGAVYNQVGALTVANCTFSGNSASASGGGAGNVPGALGNQL